MRSTRNISYTAKTYKALETPQLYKLSSPLFSILTVSISRLLFVRLYLPIFAAPFSIELYLSSRSASYLHILFKENHYTIVRCTQYSPGQTKHHHTQSEVHTTAQNLTESEHHLHTIWGYKLQPTISHGSPEETEHHQTIV